MSLQHPAGPPAEGTGACHRYFTDAGQSFGLLHFVLEVVLRADYVAHVAKTALEPDGAQSVESPAALAEVAPGPAVRHLRTQSQLLLELFLARLVDSFQCYLVELLREVLAAQPQILKSSQPSLSLEYALQFSSMDDLVADVVAKKVNDLSYQGFESLKTWCLERGVPIAVEQRHEAVLIEFIATRNIITHSRGLVDHKYLRAVPSTTLTLGVRRPLTIDNLYNSFDILNRVVSETDAAVQGKFRLSALPFPQPPPTVPPPPLA